MRKAAQQLIIISPIFTTLILVSFVIYFIIFISKAKISLNKKNFNSKNSKMIKRIWMLLLIFQQNIFAQSVLLEKTPTGNTVLSKKGASYFAKLSLECTEKDYPHFYQESMEINSSEDLKTPKQLWPSFYGCFDWHSGVHNHWALVKLLKTYPNIAEAGDIKKSLKKVLMLKMF
jgi:hypothetical protein